MAWLLIHAQRAVLALCLIILSACTSTVVCREWEIQTNITNCPQFNSGRIFLAPESDHCHLEVEIVRSSSGLRMYINILFLKALPCQEDPSLTKVEIAFDGEEEPWVIYPHLLEGGQRLLVQQEYANYLIETLLEDRSFIIKIGRYETIIIPDSFKKAYEGVMQISIEEVVMEEKKYCLI